MDPEGDRQPLPRGARVLTMGGEAVVLAFHSVQPPNTEMEPDVFAPLNEADTYGRSRAASIASSQDNADAEANAAAAARNSSVGGESGRSKARAVRRRPSFTAYEVRGLVEEEPAKKKKELPNTSEEPSNSMSLPVPLERFGHGVYRGRRGASEEEEGGDDNGECARRSVWRTEERRT